MSSNYILARSKDEEILKKAAVGGAVTGILQYLLDNNIGRNTSIRKETMQTAPI